MRFRGRRERGRDHERADRDRRRTRRRTVDEQHPAEVRDLALLVEETGLRADADDRAGVFPLFEWFGAPVPFFVGGAILLILWLIAPRVIVNDKKTFATEVSS